MSVDRSGQEHEQGQGYDPGLSDELGGVQHYFILCSDTSIDPVQAQQLLMDSMAAVATQYTTTPTPGRGGWTGT